MMPAPGPRGCLHSLPRAGEGTRDLAVVSRKHLRQGLEVSILSLRLSSCPTGPSPHLLGHLHVACPSPPAHLLFAAPPCAHRWLWTLSCRCHPCFLCRTLLCGVTGGCVPRGPATGLHPHGGHLALGHPRSLLGYGQRPPLAPPPLLTHYFLLLLSGHQLLPAS